MLKGRRRRESGSLAVWGGPPAYPQPLKFKFSLRGSKVLDLLHAQAILKVVDLLLLQVVAIAVLGEQLAGCLTAPQPGKVWTNKAVVPAIPSVHKQCTVSI